MYVMPMGDEARDLAVQITAMLRANALVLIWTIKVVL